MFTHVQCCDIVPSLVSSFGESLDIGLYFAPQLPRGFDHFYGAGRGGEPPPPHSAGRGGEPPPPRGEGSPRGGAPIPATNVLSVNNVLSIHGWSEMKTVLQEIASTREC